MPRYWIIAPFDVKSPLFDQVWQFDLNNSVISIGWNELGDASILGKNDLRKSCYSKYPGDKPGNITRSTNAVWKFFHEIDIGDIIIARRGTKILAAVGTVTKKAYYSPAKNPIIGHAFFLDVRWNDFPRNQGYDNRIVFGMFTIYEIDEERYPEFINKDTNIETEKIPDDVKERPQFYLEKYLEEFIVENFSTIFGNTLSIYKESDEVSGQQYDTGVVGKIDILCVDKDLNFIVIELKKGRESDKVMGQLLRYMGWVKEELCAEGQSVKGMIICKDPDEKLRYAVSATSNVALKGYEIDPSFFKIKDLS